MGVKETYGPAFVELGRELGTWAKEHKLAAVGVGVLAGFILLGAAAPFIDEDIDPSGQRNKNKSDDFDTNTPEDPGSIELPLENGQVVTIEQNF